MRLELSRFVASDLDEIATYIAADNPRRAVTFIQEIRTKFLTVQRTPMLNRLRPDIGEEARMATVGRYAILFRVMEDAVRIERVAYGGRDLPAMLDTSRHVLIRPARAHDPTTGGGATAFSFALHRYWHRLSRTRETTHAWARTRMTKLRHQLCSQGSGSCSTASKRCT